MTGITAAGVRYHCLSPNGCLVSCVKHEKSLQKHKTNSHKPWPGTTIGENGAECVTAKLAACAQLDGIESMATFFVITFIHHVERPRWMSDRMIVNCAIDMVFGNFSNEIH